MRRMFLAALLLPSLFGALSGSTACAQSRPPFGRYQVISGPNGTPQQAMGEADFSRPLATRADSTHLDGEVALAQAAEGTSAFGAGLSAEMARALAVEAAKQNGDGEVLGQHAIPSGASAVRTLGQIGAKSLDIEAFAVHADGVTDDTLVLQTALNLAAASGSDSLNLGPHQYLVDSANLVIPARTRLACTSSIMGENLLDHDYSHLPCTIRLNPTYQIQQSDQASIDGVNILNSTYVVPTTLRQALTLVAAYSGVAVYPNGSDTSVSNSTILGFNTCIQNNGRQRQRANHIYGDCTNGLYLSQSHDISRWNDIHLWPFLTAHASWSNNGVYVSNGAAPNGSGGVRITFAGGAEPPLTGDRVCLTGTQGLPYSFRGCYTATVIDALHLDLQGAVWPTETVTLALSTTAGSCSAISTNTYNAGASAGPSMIMAAGDTFAAGTLTTAVYQNIVTFSPCALASTTASNVQFGPSSVAGGNISLDPLWRRGTGFNWNHSENSTCDQCFEYGYETGFHFDAGSAATTCTGCGADAPWTESNTSRAIDIAPGAYSTAFIGGYFYSYGTLVYASDTLSGTPTLLVGAQFAPGSLLNPSIFIGAGSLSMTGGGMGQVGYTADIAGRGSIYIADGATNALFVGNNLGLAKFTAQSAASAAKLLQSSNFSGGGP